MNKDQEGVLKRFLNTIFEISDLEFQEKIWIKGLGPECSSFEEAICDFFDDGEPIIEKYKTFNINNIQYQKINILNDKLRKFLDKTPALVHEENIIFDPEWIEIRKLAKDVLKAFDYKKPKYL